MTLTTRAARLTTLLVLTICQVVVLGTSPATAPRADAAKPNRTVVAPAPAPESPEFGVAVPAGRFELRVVTTSDWTRVQVLPGQFVAHRTVSAPRGVTVETSTDGWRILNPTGRRVSVTVESVLSEFTGAERFTVNVDKGYVGSTQVKLTNLNGSRFVAADIKNGVRSTSDPNNRVTTSIARDAFLGTTRLQLPHADPRKLVLAFYYPWFTTYDEPTLTDRPADPRSTARYADVLSMTRQARDHGVDGFIVSWAGADANGAAFDRAHEAARQTDGLITGYLETLAAKDADGRPSLRLVFQWVEELAIRADGSFLRDQHGTPVIFVWQMEHFPAWAWQMVLDELEARDTPVRLVGDTIDSAYAGVSWGVHRYDPLGEIEQRAWSSQYRDAALRGQALLDGTDPRLHVGGVAPGYDDHLVRDGNPVIERGANGERYTETWQAELAGDPDWITITSWNEWYEGTSLEPGVAAGDLALRQTPDLASAWRR